MVALPPPASPPCLPQRSGGPSSTNLVRSSLRLGLAFDFGFNRELGLEMMGRFALQK